MSRSALASLVLFLLLGLSAPAPAPAQAAAQPPAQPAADAPRHALATRLPEVKLEGIALVDCIDFLRDVSSANLHVNWRALELIGIGKDVAISLDLRDVSLRTALRLMLAQADPAGMVTFYLDDGVIEITTRDLADSRLITKVYFVDDLLMVIPNFRGPDLNLESTHASGGRSSGSGGGGGGGSRSGQSLFDDQQGADGEDEVEQPTTKAERADQLIRLIQDIVQPDIWRDNGGVASIRYFNGHLVVTAPRSVHEAIGGPVD